MTEYLGYDKHNPESINSDNNRNGKTPKILKTDECEINISIPRDRMVNLKIK